MYSFYDYPADAQVQMAAGGTADQQQQQLMQIIQMYAQMKGQDPKQIIQQLQQLDPTAQKQALQQIVAEVQQGAQSQQQMAPQQQAAPMQRMGGQPCYNCGGMYATGGGFENGSFFNVPATPTPEIYQTAPYNMEHFKQYIPEYKNTYGIPRINNGDTYDKFTRNLVKKGVPSQEAGNIATFMNKYYDTEGNVQNIPFTNPYYTPPVDPNFKGIDDPERQKERERKVMLQTTGKGAMEIYAYGGVSGQNPNPGTYEDGYSGTSTAGQYFNNGGAFVPSYGQSAYGAMMYGGGMAQGGVVIGGVYDADPAMLQKLQAGGYTYEIVND